MINDCIDNGCIDNIFEENIMSKAQSVVLQSKHFATKKSANAFFREMLNRYKDDDDIIQEDHDLLYELLLRHPDVSQKIGCGIRKFSKRKSPDHPTSCFHLERIDGSCTDFSYKECVSSVKPTLEQYFYRACRRSVSDILIAKKNTLFDLGPVICCKTGQFVTRENSEYRHTSPRFCEIVNDFKNKYNLILQIKMFDYDSDIQSSTCFSNKEIEKKFIQFHQSVANLDIFIKFER